MIAKRYKLNIAEFIKKRPTLIKKGPFFAVKSVPNGLLYSKFGVVVGKKIDKRATERNKIKRMFYESIRSRNLQNIPGQDVMILIYPDIKQMDPEEIEKIVQTFHFI